MLRHLSVTSAIVVFLVAVSAARADAVDLAVNGAAAPNAIAVAASSTAAVAVTNGPGNRFDWVAMYTVGAGVGSYIDWFYLNGSKTAPATGVTSATVNFTMPASNGNYEFRFLPNNGFTVTATSGTVSVVPAPSLSSLTPSTGHVGDIITIAGSNFGQSQAGGGVTFNGTASTPITWSATSITARVPSGATTGSLIVTAAGQASSGLTFTVTTVATGTLAGTITRQTGGTAISGASVQAILAGVVKSTGTTAANGTYSIGSLPPGAYDVRISASGFFTEQTAATVVSSTTTTLNLALYQPGSVSGKVTQSNGTTAIVGAAVALYSGASQKGSASTNGTGDYSISGLRPGSYTVQASSAGYAFKEVSASISESANTTSNVSLNTAASGAINYLYDDASRLVGVVDAQGNAATYAYDAVGNLLSIGRSASATVSIVTFSPASGPIGATVKISGTGFSATANQNTVTFNGTSATVSSASTTQLVVTVPVSATTGTIGVTAPGGSTTSATSFTVAAASAPTITSFSPTTGVAGTSVTITGTNFDTAPLKDVTKFNIDYATVSAATSTSLTTAVPPAGASGPLTVSTTAGTVTSSSDFIIPPPPYTTSDVESASRMSYSTATTVTVSTANKIALRLFDGTAGHRISVVGSNGMTGQVFGCDVNVTVLTPMGTELAPATCMEQSGFIDAQTLPATGTYTILVDPASTATGSVTLTLYDIPADATSTITAGGSAVTLTTTVPGQNGKLTFSGTSGHRISLKGTNGMNGQVFGCDVNVSIFNPDGSSLATPTCMETSGFIDVRSLSSTGTYSIVVDPANLATGSVTLTLYDLPADASGTITPGGSAVTVTTTTPGQNGALTFSGTSGHRISLAGSNGMTGQVFGCDVNVSVNKPDGSVLAAATCMEQSGFIDVNSLATTGTYTIVVDPVDIAVGSVTLTLYDVPADTTGSVTIGGSVGTVTLSTPGQNGSLTFSGTASQQVTVHVTNNPWTTVGGGVTVKLLDTNGTTVLTSTTSTSSSFNLSTVTLSSTGTYTIVVDPSGTQTGSINVGVTSP